MIEKWGQLSETREGNLTVSGKGGRNPPKAVVQSAFRGISIHQNQEVKKKDWRDEEQGRGKRCLNS